MNCADVCKALDRGLMGNEELGVNVSVCHWHCHVTGCAWASNFCLPLEDLFSNMTCWLCGFETTELVTNAKALPTSTCENVPCQICVAVADIDKEINQAVANLQHLLAKRCDLHSEQNRVHSTLIHRLPAELKSYIFELVVPLQNEWGEIPCLGGPRWTLLPSHLASVCRNWRDIAWSNPSLWSSIHIAIKSKLDPFDQTNFLQDWIQRSKTLPLTLHIIDYTGGGLGEELKGVIDVINQCSDRWYSLSLNIPFEFLRTFRHNNSPCRLLKKLRLNGSGKISLDDIILPVPLLDSTISPETIEITNIPFWSLQFSWNQLTSATIQSIDFEDIIQIFQHASQMTDCRIFTLCDHRGFRPRIPPIIHQRLKTLSLSYGRDEDAVELLLGSLILPCLQAFHATEMMPLKYLPALVHRSSCPLTTITFNLTAEYRRYGEYRLFDGMQPLPGVTDLVVHNVERPPQVVAIKRLLLEDYFPDLRHLILGQQSFRFLWDGNAISLLDQKWLRLDATAKGIGHRKIIVIRVGDCNWAWESFTRAKLQELGLDVSLREDGFEILKPGPL